MPSAVLQDAHSLPLRPLYFSFLDANKPTHNSQRKCWLIVSPRIKMVLRKKKWWDFQKKKKRNKRIRAKNTHDTFLKWEAWFLGTATAAPPPDYAVRHLSIYSGLWSLFSTEGWRCDCRQGHESHLQTIPEHGLNLQPSLNKDSYQTADGRLQKTIRETSELDIFCTCCMNDYSLLHTEDLHVSSSLLRNSLHFITQSLPLNNLKRLLHSQTRL